MMIFQSLVVILLIFRLRKTIIKPLFVAISMTNKCAKFHGDTPRGQKLNLISRARLNFRKRPILCTALYVRNPVQTSNFSGTFNQLFL